MHWFLYTTSYEDAIQLPLKNLISSSDNTLGTFIKAQGFLEFSSGSLNLMQGEKICAGSYTQHVSVAFEMQFGFQVKIIISSPNNE